MPETGSKLTWGRLIAAGSDYLAGKKVQDAGTACEWLAACLLKCGRCDVFNHWAEIASPRHVNAMRRGLARLAKGEPLQYVLGTWDFRGITISVDQRALIPRPETEQLVQMALDCENLWRGQTPVIADVGCGSGCIAISLASERPQARLYALDISQKALRLAAVNAEKCRVEHRISFLRQELGEVTDRYFDAIISNPPYIRHGELPRLPPGIYRYEPLIALDGGEDGMEIIRRICRDAVMKLKPNGRLFLEIGEKQGMQTRRLLESLGYEQITIAEDLAGRVRFASARIS